MLNEVVLLIEIVVQLKHELILQYEINFQTNNQMKLFLEIDLIQLFV